MKVEKIVNRIVNRIGQVDAIPNESGGLKKLIYFSLARSGKTTE